MAFLAHKLVACVIILAVIFTGVACACDHEQAATSDAAGAGASVCHHGSSDPGGDHDQDQDDHQSHHDGCACATKIMSTAASPASAPDFRPAAMAAHHFALELATLSQGAFLRVVDSHTPPIALPHLHRAGTSLLRQHCALIL